MRAGYYYIECGKLRQPIDIRKKNVPKSTENSSAYVINSK